ncbi:hypothetical protein AXG93_4461s1370 [Marchantia polymorpha subsp. ruderalis]|uniref:Uncharacterized protein n=1 Tax=Marchantia polymorpha subsp. ruderalis TaxID=1480154 RepID=A0A176WPW5_MARPO|nr:hypothetical protein AXG93_4461s1370 [Marchantia polymorpha subsp. ruderalis]
MPLVRVKRKRTVEKPEMGPWGEQSPLDTREKKTRRSNRQEGIRANVYDLYNISHQVIAAWISSNMYRDLDMWRNCTESSLKRVEVHWKLPASTSAQRAPRTMYGSRGGYIGRVGGWGEHHPPSFPPFHDAGFGSGSDNSAFNKCLMILVTLDSIRSFNALQCFVYSYHLFS